MRLFRSILTLALVAGGLFATAGRSEAAFSITFTQTGTTGGPTTINDNVGADLNPATNTILANNFSLGGFLIGSTSPGGSPLNVSFTNTGSSAFISITNLRVQWTGGPVSGPGFPTLTILVNVTPSNTGTLPSGTLTNNLDALVNNGGVTVSSTASTTNPGASTSVGPIAGGASGAQNQTTFGPSTANSTLSFELTVTGFSGNGQTANFGGSFALLEPTAVTVTPAPATVLAALGCLPVLGFVGALRRRKLKEAAAV